MKYENMDEIKRMLDDPDVSLLMLSDLKHFIDAKIEAWGTSTQEQKVFRII
jgi:hypothetical protein